MIQELLAILSDAVGAAERTGSDIAEAQEALRIAELCMDDFERNRETLSPEVFEVIRAEALRQTGIARMALERLETKAAALAEQREHIGSL